MRSIISGRLTRTERLVSGCVQQPCGFWIDPFAIPLHFISFSSDDNSFCTGEWVHKQRCKWAKRDPVFMEKQYPRLQAIGFLWKVKDRNNTSWEEGYAQLEGFFQINGHLNIQPPILGDGNEQNEYQHAYEMKGQSDLHRWIQRVRMDYKMFQAGKETKLLNGERVLQLIKLGFEFN